MCVNCRDWERFAPAFDGSTEHFQTFNCVYREWSGWFARGELFSRSPSRTSETASVLYHPSPGGAEKYVHQQDLLLSHIRTWMQTLFR